MVSRIAVSRLFVDLVTTFEARRSSEPAGLDFIIGEESQAFSIYSEVTLAAGTRHQDLYKAPAALVTILASSQHNRPKLKTHRDSIGSITHRLDFHHIAFWGRGPFSDFLAFVLADGGGKTAHLETCLRWRQKVTGSFASLPWNAAPLFKVDLHLRVASSYSASMASLLAAFLCTRHEQMSSLAVRRNSCSAVWHQDLPTCAVVVFNQL